MKYNHERPFSEFEKYINELNLNGFNPIAVTQMYFENVFVFETNEEAEKAFHHFERDKNDVYIGKISGFWYGKKDFIKQIKDYEEPTNGYSKVLVYWLNEYKNLIESNFSLRIRDCLELFKNGNERYHKSPLFNNMIQMLARGISPYEVIDYLCELSDNRQKAFKEYIESNPKTISYILTASEIKK